MSRFAGCNHTVREDNIEFANNVRPGKRVIVCTTCRRNRQRTAYTAKRAAVAAAS